MSFSNDLLKQARDLAVRGEGRPKQVDLRRASSAAYYALFHFLVWEVAAFAVPKAPPGLRNRVCRAFQHGEMKQVCLPFSRGSLSPVSASLLDTPLSERLSFVATTFIELQERRHQADYDLAAHFYRSVTLQDISNAEAAMEAWGRIRNTDEATVFLAALAFGTRWSK